MFAMYFGVDDEAIFVTVQPKLVFSCDESNDRYIYIDYQVLSKIFVRILNA